MDAWVGIQAGDVGFDEGGGLIGFLIRHFSHSPYAHCWIYHKQHRDGSWETLEAYPGGLRVRRRANNNVHRVIRAWRNEDERRNLLAKSDELLGAGYNYRELLRIIHYRLRKMLFILVVLGVLMGVSWRLFESGFFPVATVVLGVLVLYGALPLKTKLSDRVICSNHVAQSVMAARPDVVLTYPPQSIWPGRLERDLNVMTWNDWTLGAEGEGIEPSSP